MATRKLLHESTSSTLAGNDGVFEVTLLTAGTGSSGKYAESMISEFGAAAFPKGSKTFFGHPTEDSPQRDARDQWGYLIEDAWPADDGASLKGKVKVLKHWREVVESLAEEGQADLSIWAMGETDDNDNVVALIPDRQNGVDLVAFPGRPGSAITTKMYESARAASVKTPDAASAQVNQKKEENMEEELKALKALVESLATQFATFVTESKAAAKADAVAEANADAIEKAVGEALSTYDEKIKAIDAAELLPSQVESLRAEARAGKDVAPLIERDKKIVTEARAALSGSTDSAGRVLESSKNEDYTVAGWVN